MAALNLRDKALAYASELLQTPAGELDIVDGTVLTPRAQLGPSMSLAEIASRVVPGAKILGDRDPGLSAEGWYNTDRLAFSYGVHVALVRVDGETGGVSIERYIVAQEVGRAVNPMLVAGQVTGGCVQGIGGTLYEEFIYSETGDPLAVTLADYLVPTVREAPAVEVLIAEDAPSPFNPLGLKGAGEGGINGVGAAIAGAVDDALRDPGAMTRLPITPQRVMAHKGPNHELQASSVARPGWANHDGSPVRGAATASRPRLSPRSFTCHHSIGLCSRRHP